MSANEGVIGFDMSCTNTLFDVLEVLLEESNEYAWSNDHTPYTIIYGQNR